MLHLSRRTTIAIKLFIMALAIMSVVVWVYYLIQTGGEGMGTTQVSDFSLCSPTESGTDGFATLTSRIVSPTSVVHVCGYLSTRIRYPADKKVCLAFYLARDSRLIYSRDYCRDTEGFFNVPLESDDLLFPGQYSLRLIDGARRNWDEVITFTVQR